MKLIQATGKRKKATARATLTEGTGKFRINGQMLSCYAPQLSRMKVEEMLVLAEDVYPTVDIMVNVTGGGVNSQAEAVRLAAAKALSKHAKKLEKVFLKYDRNLLVADVRRKESSKPNCRGQARAKKQKSYR